MSKQVFETSACKKAQPLVCVCVCMYLSVCLSSFPHYIFSNFCTRYKKMKPWTAVKPVAPSISILQWEWTINKQMRFILSRMSRKLAFITWLEHVLGNIQSVLHHCSIESSWQPWNRVPVLLPSRCCRRGDTCEGAWLRSHSEEVPESDFCFGWRLASLKWCGQILLPSSVALYFAAASLSSPCDPAVSIFCF